MKKEDIKILVACEESQAVCIEFRNLGIEAYSCDTLPCSGGHPEWHIQQDVTDLLKKDWTAIIAFPPCTYLSKAGACRLYRKAGIIDQNRFNLGLQAKDFFMQFYSANCEHVSVENPVSLKIFDMPQFTQEIEPYEYGHPFSKKTRLWLRGLPLLKPTNIVKKIGTYLPSSTSKNAYSGKNDKCTRNPIIASKTFDGIAKAMATQWTEYLLSL
jgi:hypothetical protein